MRSIGLTGGIGSGKSTVASLFRDRGFAVIDLDQIAREVVEPGSPGLSAIVNRFGGEVISDGSLNRAALAQIAFSDIEAKKALESIIHPLIRDRHLELTTSMAEEYEFIVTEVPLLVESAGRYRFDFTVSVEAPEMLRRTRLLARGMSDEAISMRMSMQASEEERRDYVQHVIENSGELPELEKQIDAFISNVLEANS